MRRRWGGKKKCTREGEVFLGTSDWGKGDQPRSWAGGYMGGCECMGCITWYDGSMDGLEG